MFLGKGVLSISSTGEEAISSSSSALFCRFLSDNGFHPYSFPLVQGVAFYLLLAPFFVISGVTYSFFMFSGFCSLCNLVTFRKIAALSDSEDTVIFRSLAFSWRFPRRIALLILGLTPT